MVGTYHNTIGLKDLLPNILEYAELNVHNRSAFAEARDYDTEDNRRIIFAGNLEEVIRLFYCGDRSDYGEIIREVNQIRRLQREIMRMNRQAVPEGWLLELSEGLPDIGIALTPRDIAAVFWPVS